MGFFLHYFAPPLGASGDEKSLYAAFIKRLVASGGMPSETGNPIVAALEKAIREQWH